MFSNLGTHLDRFPSGRYGFVGTIPATLMTWRKATESDVFANLPKWAYRNENGYLEALYTPSFETADEARKHAADNGVTLCSVAWCSCQKIA